MESKIAVIFIFAKKNIQKVYFHDEKGLNFFHDKILESVVILDKKLKSETETKPLKKKS